MFQIYVWPVQVIAGAGGLVQVLEGTVAHCYMVWVFTTLMWLRDEKAWDVDRGMLVVVNPSSEGDCTGANSR